MREIGKTIVAMNFRSGKYTGKFSVIHPDLEYPNDINEELIEKIEISVAAVIETLLKGEESE